MPRTAVAFAILFLLPSGWANANVDEFNACRDSLPPAAQTIADRVVAQLEPGIDAQKIMKSTVMDMVKNGELERSEARQSATSAAGCLMKLKG